MNSSPLRATAAKQILTVLLAAYPRAVSSTDLIQNFGPAAKSRVGELRSAGWQIANRAGADDVAEYALTSTTRAAADVVFAGVTLKHSSKTGWAARTHGLSTLPDAVLVKAQDAAMRAYSEVVNAHMKAHSKDSATCVLDFLGL
jgi:redox-regulated HSP33 family molecular chaperone